MSDAEWDEVSEQDYWYELGKCVSIELVAKELREESGRFYADGADAKATWCRDLARRYEEQGSNLRSHHDARNKRRSAALSGGR